MGKTVLNADSYIYLNLQDRVDRNKLTEPELFLDGYCWQHYHGQEINYNKLTAAADIFRPTLKKYPAILEADIHDTLIAAWHLIPATHLTKKEKIYTIDLNDNDIC